MAVVFISPKNTQRKFLMGVVIAPGVFLGFISFWVFISQPIQSSSQVAFNQPKININLKVVDTDQFKLLQHFELMPTQFQYSAMGAKNNVVSGYISALSQQDAVAYLKSIGLSVGTIREVIPGRDNPFVPYNTTIISPTTTK